MENKINKKTKVLFLTNVPSPYRVSFFNELGKFCDLTVLFERRSASNRDPLWKADGFENFHGIYLDGMHFGDDGSISFKYRKYLKKGQYDFVILCGYSSPTGVFTFLYCRRRKIPYIVSSDGAFMRKESKFRFRFKRFVLSEAAAALGTTDETLRYFRTYGISKTFKYPFTSLYEKDILKELPTETEKKLLRKKLEIKENKIVLAVGQFIHRKGFDLLIRCASRFDGDTGFYFVGGNATPGYIKLKEENNSDNVHFIGFKTKTELNDFYKMADVLVLPTREDIWGLVINEAMACGLPVITTEHCGSGRELVNEGGNGYIVPVDDADILSERINRILCDGALRKKMAGASLDCIHNFTFESMARSHIAIFNELLENNT